MKSSAYSSVSGGERARERAGPVGGKTSEGGEVRRGRSTWLVKSAVMAVLTWTEVEGI